MFRYLFGWRLGRLFYGFYRSIVTILLGKSNAQFFIYLSQTLSYAIIIQMENSSKTEIKRISGLPSELKSAAVCFCFSPDSKYLASAGKNKIISVVELTQDENISLLYQLNTNNTGNFTSK